MAVSVTQSPLDLVAPPLTETSLRILVIEDDLAQADIVAQGLGQHGHIVAIARDGLHGLMQARSAYWDVIVLDRRLPDMDGIVMVRSLRAAGFEMPIVFVTGLIDPDERIAGLTAGADDYLCKPFVFGELLARIVALTRRRSDIRIIRAAGVELDIFTRRINCDGQDIALRTKEAEVLEYLMRRVGQFVTRDMLLRDVWSLQFDPGTNIVENTISRIRTKMDVVGRLHLIRTARGRGYIIEG